MGHTVEQPVEAIRLCEELHGNDNWELDTIYEKREADRT